MRSPRDRGDPDCMKAARYRFCACVGACEEGSWGGLETMCREMEIAPADSPHLFFRCCEKIKIKSQSHTRARAREGGGNGPYRVTLVGSPPNAKMCF